MSKCYVVYTDYQEDTMILNNLQHNVVINNDWQYTIYIKEMEVI